jgi:membrane fusion protein (multidrug efflux system)
MNFTKLFGLLIVSFLLIASCKSEKKGPQPRGNAGQRGPGQSERAPVMVDVIIAGSENVTSSLEVNGTVLSNEMVELRPETSGRLVYLNIPDGAKVAQGAVLARVNDAELQAQLEQQKSQLDLAKKTEKRLADLLKVNGVNQADYDAALNQLNSIQANIKVTTALIDKTVIKAPFTGELGLRQVSQGAYVTPSTLLGTLQQTDKVKIDFTIPETYTNIFQKGDKVRILTASSSESLEAAISAIEPQINSVTRNIKVRALLTKGVILPGAFVKVILDQNWQSIMVPSNAIIPDALSNQVVVIRKNKAVFTNVETGVRNENQIELIKGVNAGDSIVVSGMLFVRPNAPVKVKKVMKLNEV